MVNGPDVALTPTTLFVDVKIAGLVQLASFGPYRLNVTVPVGLVPPVTLAVSLSAVPIAPPAEAIVAIAGDDLLIVADSLGALQAAETALLFASPL